MVISILGIPNNLERSVTRLMPLPAPPDTVPMFISRAGPFDQPCRESDELHMPRLNLSNDWGYVMRRRMSVLSGLISRGFKALSCMAPTLANMDRWGGTPRSRGMSETQHLEEWFIGVEYNWLESCALRKLWRNYLVSNLAVLEVASSQGTPQGNYIDCTMYAQYTTTLIEFSGKFTAGCLRDWCQWRPESVK